MSWVSYNMSCYRGDSLYCSPSLVFFPQCMIMYSESGPLSYITIIPSHSCGPGANATLRLHTNLHYQDFSKEYKGQYQGK